MLVTFSKSLKKALPLALAFSFLTLCWPVEGFAADNFASGKTYFAKKDYRSAKMYFDKAATDTPWDSNVLYYQGLTAQYLRDWEGAKAVYKKLVEQFPGTDAERNARAALNSLEPGWEKKAKQASSSSSSSTSAAAGSSPADMPAAQVQAPAKSRVPVVRTGDKVYIDVAVNGHTTRLEFAGDESTLNLKDALALQLVDKSKPPASGTKVPVTIKMAEITQKGFPLVIGGMNDRSKIGEDFFKKFNYTLDPTGITANYRLASSNKGGYDLPFRKSGKDLMVDVSVNGRRVSVAFDETAGECVVPAARAREFGLDVQETSEANMFDPVKNPNGPVRGDSGYGEVKKNAFAEARIQVGPVTTPGVRIKVDDQATVARIGPAHWVAGKQTSTKASNVIHINR